MLLAFNQTCSGSSVTKTTSLIREVPDCHVRPGLLSTAVQVQCTGFAPTVSIDKCDGVQAYIPAALGANPNFQVRYQLPMCKYTP